jgi:hypothetical protein
LETLARKRFVDPAMFSDPRFNALPGDSAKIFWVGVFANCDDHGRILWQHRSLAGLIFPVDEDKTIADIRGMMKSLEEVGLVHSYASENLTFAHLPGWKNHQAPSHPAASKLPNPPCCEKDRTAPVTPRETPEKSSRKTHEEIVKDSLLGWVGLGLIRGGEENASLPDVLAFVALVAEENKTGRIADSRVSGIVALLGDILAEAKDFNAFRSGLREATAKGKPNVNYVRACVRSALERSGSGFMPKRREPNRTILTADSPL